MLQFALATLLEAVPERLGRSCRTRRTCDPAQYALRGPVLQLALRGATPLT